MVRTQVMFPVIAGNRARCTDYYFYFSFSFLDAQQTPKSRTAVGELDLDRSDVWYTRAHQLVSLSLLPAAPKKNERSIDC